jgi:heme/copper-type cytochrome/quinol oxidase subunit 2
VNSLKQIVKKINFLKIVEVAAAVMLTLTPVAVSALDLPNCNSFRGVNCSSANGSVSGLILYVINIMLGIAGLVAVLFLIIGGFWYITSAGNEETAEKGKGTVINAIIGIVIIILSYVVVNVVSGLVTNPNSSISAP